LLKISILKKKKINLELKLHPFSLMQQVAHPHTCNKFLIHATSCITHCYSDDYCSRVIVMHICLFFTHLFES